MKYDNGVVGKCPIKFVFKLYDSHRSVTTSSTEIVTKLKSHCVR